jgi:hypothetical protein
VAEPQVHHKLAAILVADVAGYSALMDGSHHRHRNAPKSGPILRAPHVSLWRSLLKKSVALRGLA